MEGTHDQKISWQSRLHLSILKRMSPSLSVSCSFPGFRPSGPMHFYVNMDVSSRFCDLTSCDSTETQPLVQVQVDDDCDSSEALNRKHHIERQRRLKIGLANKGKVPWNKGRKHSAETRQRIKRRTIEALRDPKVREKMVGPRAHSDDVKAKIGSSLKRNWDKRLKCKRLKEKFILSWSESIAKAAKDGGNGEQQLDWDSYEKMKQEIAFQQLQWAAEKEKEKEIAKIRAKQAARKKSEKQARLEQERKMREERAKAKREMKTKTNRKSMEEKNLRQRLIKIHRKKSLNGRVHNHTEALLSHFPVWEKLDMELVRKEKMQKNISLADEIRAAKSKKADSASGKVLVTSSSSCSSTEWE